MWCLDHVILRFGPGGWDPHQGAPTQVDHRDARAWVGADGRLVHGEGKSIGRVGRTIFPLSSGERGNWTMPEVGQGGKGDCDTF